MIPTKHREERGLAGARGGALRGSQDRVILREVSGNPQGQRALTFLKADTRRNNRQAHKVSVAAGGRDPRGVRGWAGPS